MNYFEKTVGECAHYLLVQAFLRVFRIGRTGNALKVAVAGEVEKLQSFGEILCDEPDFTLEIDYLTPQASLYCKSYTEFDARHYDLLLVIGPDIESEQRVARELASRARDGTGNLAVFYWGTLLRTMFGLMQSFDSLPTCLNFKKLFAVVSGVAIARSNMPIFECGVFQGGLTALMARLVQQLDGERTIHAFDTFEGMPAPSQQDLAASIHYPQGFFGETSVESVQQLWRSLRVETGIVTYPGLIENTLGQCLSTVGSPGFALLDMDSYSAIGTSLELLAKHNRTRSSVKTSSLVLIDDYSMPAVKQAVTEVASKYDFLITPITHNLVGALV